jgi:hypothetical protein
VYSIRLFVLFLLSCTLLHAGEEAARYDAADRHALHVPASAAASIKTLSAYLTKPFSTEEEKSRAIFRWVTDNISYDVEGFFSGKPSASGSKDILRSRTSVCEGYSTLFEAIGKAAGLEVSTIDGYAKGFGYQAGDKISGESNHAWNAVKIRGEWKLVDCTWGAGKVNDDHTYQKEFEPYYFFTKPEEFVYRHLPTDERWQLLKRPVSRDEFQRLPFLNPSFFLCGLQLGEGMTAVLAVEGRTVVEISAPADALCLAEMEQGRRKIDGAVFLQRKGPLIQISLNPPGTGDYILNVYAKKESDIGGYPLAASFKVTARSGDSKDTRFPLMFSTFVERKAQLQSPLIKELPSGTVQQFSLLVPGAERMAVVGNEEWDFLEKHGEQFEGTVEIGTGTITVYAKYPGESNMMALLEYFGTGSVRRAPAPVKFKKFMETGAELIAPAKKEQSAGAKVLFRLRLPGAQKAAVVCGEEWQHLRKSGEIFEGEVTLGRGKNTVFASYSSAAHYEGLLEYVGK